MNKRQHGRTRLMAAIGAFALIAAACTSSGVSAAAGAMAPAGTAATHHAAGAHDDCDAHAGDSSRQPEHCAAMGLTNPMNANAIAIASGAWSDPATWGGVLPADGATVHVPEGTTVTVDGVVGTEIHWVRVDGTLSFASDTDTELSVDTLVSSPTGLFEMGTASAPIRPDATARVTITDTGPIDRTSDPTAIGRGLVLHGRTVINGAEKTAFLELARPARAGDSTLVLTSAPQDWAAGDTLAVAGTASDATGDETATIAAIDGATVTLTAALAMDHVGPEADLNVHVANLSRNAVIESAAEAIDRRGHVMFMHTSDVEVANAGFYRLGRTNKLEELTDRIVDQGIASVCVSTEVQTNVRGRYSVHFHRAGVLDTGAAVVRGSVATDNPGWAYVNHSSNVDFISNVAYDVDGAAFNTEAGDEIGSFRDNISIRTHGTGGSPVDRQFSQDYGHEGHGFWFQGGGVIVEGNVAAGATGAGFIFYTESLLEPHAGRVWFPAQNLSFDTGGLEQVPVVQVPILDFRNNEAYGSEIGARTYYHRTDITVEVDEALAIAGRTLGFPQSRVEDLTLWSTHTGWMSNYTIDTVFSGLRIVGADGEGVGFDATNVYNRGVHRYENFDVSGHEIGLIASLAGDVTIDGGTFDNREHNILLNPPRQVERRVLVTGEPTFAGSAPEVSAVADLRVIVDGDDLWYLLDDRIILDYGQFNGEQLFYPEQAADVVLFDQQPIQASPEDPGAEIEDEILGLTNAEINALTGSSFGGTFVTADAVSVNGLQGLVGTPAPDPGPLLTAEQQMQNDLSEAFEDSEEGEFDGLGQTIVAPNCEEALGEFEIDEELIEECEALASGDSTDEIDQELADECADLEAGLAEDEGNESDEGDAEPEVDLRTELADELTELDQEELEEIRIECTELLASAETQDDAEYVEECQIVLELISG